jgi:mannan endo-1,4-beta-mannosidase
MSKIFGLILILFCGNLFALVDSGATQSTVDLYDRLKATSGNSIFYGEYIEYLDKQIETFKITGKFPAVYMFDYDSTVWDNIKFRHRKYEIVKHHIHGGIISMCWTMKNFVTNGTCRDLTGDPVANILEGGTHRSQYLEALDNFAKDIKKIKIPIIFRPFLENDTHSFWWGTEGCTPEQFITLWRDLVTYLRDTKGVHNILYCYSPEILTGEYKGEHFPGENYVDIYAIDNYSNSDDILAVISRYGKASDAALEDGKVFGVSEGMRKLSDYPKSDYWTWYYNQILADPKASRASFVCNWVSPYWGCKKGRDDEASFLEMSKNPKIRFLERKKGIILTGVTIK